MKTITMETLLKYEDKEGNVYDDVLLTTVQIPDFSSLDEMNETVATATKPNWQQRAA